MNAVEIEEAISALAEQPFDAAEFPYAFLEAFGRKETTLKRLRSGEMNKSDLGGVLQRDNIHIAVAAPGAVTQTKAALRASPATTRWKAKFIVATDGQTFEAEELGTAEAPIVCPYREFPDHFRFFLPLAGISTVKQIRESAFDTRAPRRPRSGSPRVWRAGADRRGRRWPSPETPSQPPVAQRVKLSL